MIPPVWKLTELTDCTEIYHRSDAYVAHAIKKDSRPLDGGYVKIGEKIRS